MRKIVIRDLITALIQAYGNKRYMLVLEKMLERLDELSSEEQQAIHYLILDIRNTQSNMKHKISRPWLGGF